MTRRHPTITTYHFEVPDDGSYNFWIRANPQGKPVLKYQLDDGDVEQVDFSNATQRLNIAADGQPDLRYVAWIDVGKVELSAGRHSLSLEMASKNKNHGGVDVIVFSKEAFTPNHALKPGENPAKPMQANGHSSRPKTRWKRVPCLISAT